MRATCLLLVGLLSQFGLADFHSLTLRSARPPASLRAGIVYDWPTGEIEVVFSASGDYPAPVNLSHVALRSQSGVLPNPGGAPYTPLPPPCNHAGCPEYQIPYMGLLEDQLPYEVAVAVGEYPLLRSIYWKLPRLLPPKLDGDFLAQDLMFDGYAVMPCTAAMDPQMGCDPNRGLYSYAFGHGRAPGPLWLYVANVPEPSGLVLLCLAGSGLILAGRKKSA